MTADRFHRVLRFAERMGYTSVECVERHVETSRHADGFTIRATLFLKCGGTPYLWNLDAVVPVSDGEKRSPIT